jgi:hypothetical protein
MLTTKGKRRKGCDVSSRAKRGKNVLEPCSMLRCLPDAVLGQVALFLSKSSQSFLAAAVAYVSSAKDNRWAILDFSDLDKEVQSRLTDDDLNSVLCSIDAPNTLRTLKLTGCINITGRGLGVLRGAVNLRQIDLSLAGQHESPILVTEPTLSQAIVVPILNSIVGRLRHIQLPKQWRIQSSPMLQRFLNNYSNCLTDRCVTCSGERYERSLDGVFQFIACNQVIAPAQFMNESGLQNFTCYECNDNFCTDCGPEFCGTCDKMLCDECGPVNICIACNMVACEECKQMKSCDGCLESHCIDCFIDTCSTCNVTLCDDCGMMEICASCVRASCGVCGMIETCASCQRNRCGDCCPILVCEGWGCSEMNCIECEDRGGKVNWCKLCNRSYCFNCRYDEYINSEAGFCEMCQYDFVDGSEW